MSLWLSGTFLNKLVGMFNLFVLLLMLLVASAKSNVEAPPCRPITLAEVKIICIGAGVGSFTPAERAQAIESRILQLSRGGLFDPAQLEFAERENGVDVLAGDLVLMNLTAADAYSADEKSPLDLAQKTIVQIKQAIDSDREMRSSQAILTSVIYSTVATLILIFSLFWFQFIFPRLYSRIQSLQGTMIRSLRIQSFEILTAERLVEFLLWLTQVARLVLTLLLIYIYIPFVLSQFPLTATWAPMILNYILDPLKQMAIVAIEYIPNLFFVIAIIIVTRFVLKVIGFFFTEIHRGTIHFSGFYREWAQPTYKLVRVLIFAFALIMAFPYLPGSSSLAFQGVSVFLGLLLSFGSSSAISNMVAGIVLTYMRPFSIGDRVKIADTIGDVTEKTLLVTRIHSIKNVDITIPNAMVLNSHIINYSSSAASKGLILNTTVTIGYDVPWRLVHQLLLEAASRTEMVMENPKPFILQTSLNDFYVTYELNVTTGNPNAMAVIYSDLHKNIQDAFFDAGVEIMSPHFSAIRDGNEAAIPAEKRAPDYVAPKFKFETSDKPG